MRCVSKYETTALVLAVTFLIFGFGSSYRSYASTMLPANDTLTSKITDTLKAITSNVSNSIQDNIDKTISDTMDITINNAMNQLDNATLVGNNDASAVKFEPKVPSGLDISQ